MTNDATLDKLLRALADGTRRAMLDRLRDRPGLTLTELLDGFRQSRQALSKHLGLLEEVELVVPLWRGREKRHFLNPAPLQALPARWITTSSSEDSAAMAALREALEQTPSRGEHTPPTRTASSRKRSAHSEDPLIALLLRAPAPELRGQPVMQEEALRSAIVYLEESAEAMRLLLTKVAPDAGYAKPRDGSFSLVEHIWHLADVEELGWHPRFRRILEEDRPRLAGVDGDRLAIERAYQAQPWRGAARRFLAERRKSLALLRRFDAEVLRRPVHFAGSRTRAGGVLAAAVAHDLDHRPVMADRLATLSPN